MSLKIFEVNLEFKDKKDNAVRVSTPDGISELHRISPFFEKKLKEAVEGKEESLEFVGNEMGFLLFAGKIGERFKRELDSVKEGEKLIIKVNSDDP
jgi:hypothetical protein